ncbi:MAG: FAD:protein FMN transferase [Polyangiaceae bacterium]|nr:FAD:protein FMN transferase [Polyangiaceae bacterium]
MAAFAAWQAPPLAPPENAARGSAPTRIMGTTCRLLAVPPRTASAAEATAITNQALEGAEAALRAVEAEMSTHIDDTPLSRFNRSAVGQRISLPPATLAVLRASEEAWYDTDGAFDVTSRPLIELWRTAGRRRRAPPAEEIDATRRRSSWSGLQLGATGATKRVSGVEVDVGGVAKGWAIDRAILRMATAGATGGLVDVGGDLRVFGSPPAAGPWQVRVQDPFGDGTILTLRMAAGAICTSGDYFRFVEIDGRRLSHIVDPRTGYPAAAVHSASVVAPTATSADVWATALSVLGEAGLSRLPAGHEAMLVLGEREAPHAIATPGFPTLVVEGPPYPLAIAGR